MTHARRRPAAIAFAGRFAAQILPRACGICEINRCLKRCIARQLHRIMNDHAVI